MVTQCENKLYTHIYTSVSVLFMPENMQNQTPCSSEVKLQKQV